MFKFIGFNADFGGFVTSSICAVHCMAMPILFYSGAFSAASWMHNHTFDFLIIILGVFFALRSSLKSVKVHHSYGPLGICMLGFAVLGSSFLLHDTAHAVVSAVGGILVATSHYLNFKKLGASCTVKLPHTA